MSSRKVWDAASRVREPCEMIVNYDSRRSNEEKSMRGKVTEVVARGGKCRIRAVRDDGQKIEVREDGKLYSIGSDFPVTGYIYDIRIVYDTSESVFGEVV